MYWVQTTEADQYASDAENEDTEHSIALKESFVTTAKHSTTTHEFAESNPTTHLAQQVARSQGDITPQQHHHP